ncbi:MAG TPA: hypothetical protein VMZ53_11100, partial [Kofleriaceae bacterium]|nr:hypothetical protein [Kofleriaceae bacterium]
EVCPMGKLTGTKTLSGPFSTDATNTMCDSTQLWRSTNANTCFVVGNTITVTDLQVTGTRPLALVANTINVTGHLDAASRVTDGKTGPNSTANNTCGNPGTPSTGNGAGGGVGASFAPQGMKAGSGGNGFGGGGASAINPFLTVPPGTLRARCRGQTGATGNGGGGLGGYGGGAVYLLGAQTISIGAAGIVDACGAGGGTAGKEAGGGGGGSGGMIILWAGTFSLTAGAIVVANGGSGSTGGDSNQGGAGTRGNDPDYANPQTPAPGPTTPAGKGGNGFAQGTSATAATNGGEGTATGDGGGGGGGAGGYIQSNMALTNAKVSPAANVVQ